MVPTLNATVSDAWPEELWRQLIGPFAHMILAAVNESSLVIAQAYDPGAAGAEGRAEVEQFLRRPIVA